MRALLAFSIFEADDERLIASFAGMRVFVEPDVREVFIRVDDRLAIRARERTSCSFRIECQPGTPRFFAMAARSLTVKRFSFSVVNGLFSGLRKSGALLVRTQPPFDQARP